MQATLLSIILSALIYFIPFEDKSLIDLKELAYLFTAISGIILISLPIVYGLLWSPLQKAEQNITPRIVEMFNKDTHLKWGTVAIFILPLLSLVLFVLEIYAFHIEKTYIFLAWIVILGISLDIYRSLLKRMTSYLDPFKVASMLSAEAKEYVEKNQIDEISTTIDSLAEISARAVERSNSSLASESISELKEIGVNFLKSAKNLTNLDQDLKSMEQAHEDKVGYTLYYLLNRFEMVFDRVVPKKFEPLCNQIISSIGRVTISAAKYDISLATIPFQSIGQLTLKAQAAGMKEVAIKSQILLIEVAKTILKEIDVTYLELKTPFLTLINYLDQIAEETFRLNKNTNIQVLLSPFMELKELFKSPALEKHQDTPLILVELERAMDSFKALQMVMNTIPPIPQVEESTPTS